jgi:hypothetical protein
VKFRGYLANENAELFRALIHAGARPHKTVDGEPDPRSRDKRQADALTAALDIAAAAIEAGQMADRSTSAAGQSASRPAPGAGSVGESTVGTVPGLGAKAQLTVTIDFEDLKAATADASGQLVYGDGLSAATVRRLACDAKIIPLVLGSNSEPLDVGRSERLVTRAIRRALNARDNGCVICGAPPVMCDAHHLISWIDGGQTKVSNLALVCRRHHVDLHHGTWTVSITDGAVHVTRPTWADPPPGSQRQYRHRPHHPVGPDPLTHSQTDSPAASDPAGDPVAPVAPRSRWRADAAILHDAAAFASAAPTAG